MDKDAIRVSTAIQPDGRVTVAVFGYLDEKGGSELARKILEDLPGTGSRVEINLEAVILFSCSGARRLLTALEELQSRNRDVALVGVRQTLQKILHFAA